MGIGRTGQAEETDRELETGETRDTGHMEDDGATAEAGQKAKFTEVLSAMMSLKDNKSPDPDGLPTEFLKQGGCLITRYLHKLIYYIWQNEKIPQEWKDYNIVIIYKKKGNKYMFVYARMLHCIQRTPVTPGTPLHPKNTSKELL